MRRVYIIITILFFFTQAAFSQSGGSSIKFDNMVHDFGTIKEVDGPVTHRFTFENTGEKPLLIHNVEKTCGCERTDYTKSPVMPGKTGFVDVEYDPEGSSPKFSKSITVYSNAVQSPVVLKIRGTVITKTTFDKHVGQLKLSSDRIDFKKTKHDKVKSETIYAINPTSKPLNVSFVNVPKHIEINCFPSTIAPGDNAKITAKYNASKKNDWGYVEDRLKVLVNGKHHKGNTLIINANIYEDFSELTAQEKANAPKISVDNARYDFGTAKQNTKIKHSFVISNKGKNPLIIRKAIPRKGIKVLSVSPKTIKAGQSGKISVVFDTENRKGRQIKNITLITNDPENATIRLKLTGTVE